MHIIGGAGQARLRATAGGPSARLPAPLPPADVLLCSARPHAITALPQEGKLSASEELGDLFKGASDWDTAQAIYQQAGASGKVVEALAAKGDFEQLAQYTRSSGASPDYLFLLQRLAMDNPEAAANLAKMVAKQVRCCYGAAAATCATV